MCGALTGLRKPNHRSNNYAYWTFGYGAEAERQAERLAAKLQGRPGIKQVKVVYLAKPSVHVYY